ncbi:glucose-1-phosphate cytidylyltransferase [Pseudoroseomonas globiformis]|uniref:Glucose-1-phosphate cytidylyltransferase n=1 Tax=Teichococcus globiformis TaxID=2307229 RepID=A0ABV7FZZ8_9PROT
MKAVILAGGLGTRLAEETSVRPKPMVEIGGKPILWHIMKIYSAHGINDFIVCLGYKGSVIKDYFKNYFMYMSDVTFDLQKNTMEVHNARAEDWRVTLVETGEDSMTGGRIKRVLPYLRNEEAFCLTYGDGVGDVDITETVALHKREGRLATMTATQPAGRFGALQIEGNQVKAFKEKVQGDGGWINGGFFVLSPRVGDYIEGDATTWEDQPIEQLVADNQMSVHHHHGFWHPMDTIRDRSHLEKLWASGKAPWRVWKG